MKMRFNKQIGNDVYQFEVEGRNLYELVSDAQKLSFNNVKQCGICNGTNLKLNARLAKDQYKYTEIKCMNPDCKASLTFGQRREDSDVFFLRRNERKEFDWKVYTPKEQTGGDNPWNT